MIKNGFTLIELLAVIVILAIISLIAVPIVLNIIRDTKEKAIKINAENYMNAVELAVADGHMVKGEKVLISGTYDIIDNGKVIKLIKDSNDKPILEEEDQIELQVKYTGEGLKDGIVKLIDGKVRKVTDVMTNEDYHVLIILGEVKILKKVNPVTLTTGQNFNSKIKTLVSGTETKYYVADEKVKSIEFLGYGIIPSGYTLEEFQKLERVDVSANSDETIYAIYDGNGKVYIYAEDKIIFNKSSNNMFEKFSSSQIISFGEYIDTSKVINISFMFLDCKSLTSLDANSFDTSKITNMQQIFLRCESLVVLKVNDWDISGIKNMFEFFGNCGSLIELDVNNWNTSNVTNMNRMFKGCSNLIELDVSNWDTSKVTNMSEMFSGCKKLERLNVSKWDTSQVTNMTQMFYGCSSLTELDVSNFDTSQITNMGSMFSGCRNLTTLDVSNFNTSNVTSMSRMFCNCNKLEKIDLSNFDTSNVTNMYQMFFNCINIKKLNVSAFDTSNVLNLREMFTNCKKLETLNLSNFDTLKVTTMAYMFQNTTTLKPIYIGEKWVINEGTDTTGMFSGSATKNIEQLCEPGSTEEWCVVNE